MSYDNNNKCVDCFKLITDISARCRKCSRRQLQSHKNREKDKIVILEMFQSGFKIGEIAKKLNCSNVKVSGILGECGFDNLQSISSRRYSIDESVMDTDTPEKYYILGLLATDGTVSLNRNSKYVSVSLHRSDDVLLNDLRSIFKTDKPLHYSSTDNQAVFTIFSSRIYDIVASFGIVGQKSLTLEIKKDIPDKFLADFLRGCFDGDGGIREERGKADILLCISGSRVFAEQIVNYYKRMGIDVYCYNYFDTKNNNYKYHIKKCGKGGLFILANLYKSAGLFLPRKYEKFLELTRLTIDEMMMEMAFTCAGRSTCIRRKVGCIITNEDKTNILAMGYNGGIKNFANSCESSLPGQCGCVHAEANALIKANGPILYCTTLPCYNCAKLIVNAGVKQVYYGCEYRYNKVQGVFGRAGVSLKRISKDGEKRKDYKWKLEILKILNKENPAR